QPVVTRVPPGHDRAREGPDRARPRRVGAAVDRAARPARRRPPRRPGPAPPRAGRGLAGRAAARAVPGRTRLAGPQRGNEPDMSPAVVVFAPSPLLTVTIEDRAGAADIHVHPGGQGVWQARMISSLGVPTVLCAALGGETGEVLGHLLTGEDVELRTGRVGARNSGYVHDRRSGSREEIAEAPGAPLDRHDQDALYELVLAEGLEHGTVILAGPNSDQVVP